MNYCLSIKFPKLFQGPIGKTGPKGDKGEQCAPSIPQETVKYVQVNLRN